MSYALDERAAASGAGLSASIAVVSCDANNVRSLFKGTGCRESSDRERITLYVDQQLAARRRARPARRFLPLNVRQGLPKNFLTRPVCENSCSWRFTPMSVQAQNSDVSTTVVASPCTSVCKMSPATGLCEGCLRTIDEIAHWGLFDDDEKRAVLTQLAVRRAAA